MAALPRRVWPEFMFHDQVATRYWDRLVGNFPDLQVVLVDRLDNLVAIGNSIPIVWDGTVAGLPSGWDAVVERGVLDMEQGRRPNAASALSTTMAPEYAGRGLSSLILRGLKHAAADRGLKPIIGPVRPSYKQAYPLTPMERYVRWTRADGAPLDPWLRVHWRLGARVLAVCPASMVISGTVAEWETWTGMAFPESGPYVVPGALEPVQIDRERDQGRYAEPNVWMEHPR
jgi:hypothetical protein